MRAIVLVIVSAFIVFSGQVNAQDLTREKIRIYTTADGLRDDFIKSMDQDKEGNLWIGTDSGASKFDGKSFTNYGVEYGFSDKQVWAVLCDSKGFIWFGTKYDGLFRFDGKRWEQFTKEKNGLSSDNFFNGFLYEDRAGNIWGGSNNLNVFKYSNNKFKSFYFKGKGAAEDKENNLYITRGQNVHLLPKGSNQFKIVDNQFNYTNDISIDRNNHIWVLDNDNIAKSTDSGQTFTKYPYEKTVGIVWDLFIDNNNQIWTGTSNYVVRFDGSKFHYYNNKNGLPGVNYYYNIFQDQQGHLWFGCDFGLAKFDNIPPKLKLSEPIADVVKSQSLSFRIQGDDGRFGSPSEDLTFEYRLSQDKKWQKAEQGQVNLDNLKDETEYHIQVRVTDGFQNSQEMTISFRTAIAAFIPKVIITNRDTFLKPVEESTIAFSFKGEDDKTAEEDLLFRYKLDKEEQTISGWTVGWIKNPKEARFQDLRIGEYSFSIQVKDQDGKVSEPYKIIFTIDAIVDKPKISLADLKGCYFVEQDNRPVLQCDPLKRSMEIMAGRITFNVKNIDSRPEKKNLTYSVQLEPIHRNWTTYRESGQYEFMDLDDGEYILKVRAKDQEEFVSLPVKFPFNIKGFLRLPQSSFKFGSEFGKGKIVGKIVELCWEADKDSSGFSYRLDGSQWSVFQKLECFEFPVLPTARHSFEVLAINEFGIEPVPARHEFDFERVSDLPFIRFTSKPPDLIASHSVTFAFEGQDDMEQ